MTEKEQNLKPHLPECNVMRFAGSASCDCGADEENMKKQEEG